MSTKKLSVTDYKGIRGTVEADLNGSLIIQGKNAAGKSSFIDAITELFDTKGLRSTPKPIHEGETYAKAEYINEELNLRIVREWELHEGEQLTSSLSVYALDGAKYSRPSDVIKNLTGGLIFDPSKYLQLDPKPQRDMLLTKVKFSDGFDLEAVEREEAAAMEERLAAFQAKQAANGAVTNATKPPADTPDRPVSTAELVAELDKAKLHNQVISKRKDQLAEFVKQISDADEEIIRLQARIQELEDVKKGTKVQIEATEKALAESEIIDLEPLQERVSKVDEINRNVQLREILENLRSDARHKEEAHDIAEARVQAIIARKKKALESAIFPDPHLSVDSGQVLYDGIPFSQVNTASQRKAAFSIATSGDPDLKLVIVKDGDLLDEESLRALASVADERGFDVLIERGRPDVGEGLLATFIEFEDGQLR